VRTAYPEELSHLGFRGDNLGIQTGQQREIIG
jgi:hypothetical protein